MPHFIIMFYLMSVSMTSYVIILFKKNKMLQYDQRNDQSKDEKNNDIYIRLIDIGKPQTCKQEYRYFWRDLANIAIPFIFFIGIIY